MTQRYDGLEDRIQVSLQDVDGRVVCLWLTLRLANMMLGVLSRWTDELEADLKSPKKEDSNIKSTEIVSDVKNSAAKEDALLTTVDFNHGDRGYVLTFKWGVTGAARMSMQAKELRQYMEGFSRLYDIAKWPKTAWTKGLLSFESIETDPAKDFERFDLISHLVH